MERLTHVKLGVPVLALVLTVLVAPGCQSNEPVSPGADTQTPIQTMAAPTAAEGIASPGATTQTPMVVIVPPQTPSPTPVEEIASAEVAIQTPMVAAVPSQTPSPAPTPTPARAEDPWVNVPGQPGVSRNSSGTMYKEAAFPCGPFMGYLREYPPDVLLWATDGSHLVFSNRGAVWTIDERGTQLQAVLDAKAAYATEFAFVDFLFGFYADLSPDGAQLAYTSCQFPTEYEDPAAVQAVITQDGPEWYERTLYEYEIALSGLDGSNQRRITHNDSHEHYPVWSPDGDRIAFIRGAYGGQLSTMSPDGSDVTPVSPAGMKVARVPPVWSPNGQRLAFVANEGELYLRDERNIYTVRTDGSELFKAAEMGGLASGPTAAPTWSQDSLRIAFTSFFGDEVTVHTVQFDGVDLRQVWSSNPRTDSYPQSVSQVSWSPDGAELLFIYDRLHFVNDRLYFVRPDGGGLRQLDNSTFSGDHTVAAWSPDGSRIAVYTIEAWPSPMAELYVMSRDGTNLRVLVNMDDTGNLVALNPEEEETP